MILYFGDNAIERILFVNAPQATMYPMKKADHEELKMTGFNWISEIRPMSLADLFTPKKARPRAVLPVAGENEGPPNKNKSPSVKPVGQKGGPKKGPPPSKEKSGTNKE